MTDAGALAARPRQGDNNAEHNNQAEGARRAMSRAVAAGVARARALFARLASGGRDGEEEDGDGARGAPRRMHCCPRRRCRGTRGPGLNMRGTLACRA